MKIIIVGAGASGMMAAITAARRPGVKVTIIEKNKSCGRKMFITGKGRCNVTNASDISDFFEKIPKNPEFLYSALYSFSNEMLMDWLKEKGLKLKTERGQRVFPVSDKSSDVIQVFTRELKKLGVEVLYDTKVTGIMKEGDRITGVKTTAGLMTGDHFILAAGGGSYPLTGSDGAVLGLLKKLGVRTHDFTPSLIPFIVAEKDVKDLAGVSLRNVRFSLYEGKKMLFTDIGEMLFTHNGLSGPLVLSASCLRRAGDLTGAVDLKPGLSHEELDLRILKDFQKYQNRALTNGLSDLLIQRLIPIVLDRAGIPGTQKIHDITKEQRKQLLNVIKRLEFTVTGTKPLAEAIISRGGVDVGEIDPSTMRLVAYQNLSVSGELIDVDAFTGGYNLQIAFSTGYLAGENAGRTQ